MGLGRFKKGAGGKKRLQEYDFKSFHVVPSKVC